MVSWDGDRRKEELCDDTDSGSRRSRHSDEETPFESAERRKQNIVETKKGHF